MAKMQQKLTNGLTLTVVLSSSPPLSKQGLGKTACSDFIFFFMKFMSNRYFQVKNFII
jgi:hypothetical protein